MTHVKRTKGDTLILNTKSAAFINMKRMMNKPFCKDILVKSPI